MLRDVLIGAIIIAVIIVLVRTILATPAIKRIREQFANGGGKQQALINTITDCPAGSTMYMYDGVAYCCSGLVNVDADDVRQTCRPGLAVRNSAPFTFCTLGPSHDSVKNCLETRAGLMQVMGEKTCPAAMPNYAQGQIGSATAAGRCCTGPTTSDMTDCADTSNAATFCNVATDPNEFKAPGSCQYLKTVAAATCPPQYSATSIAFSGTSPFAGLTVPSCTEGTVNCYSPAVIARLAELGYSTSGLPVCTSTGAPAAGTKA